MGIKKIKTKLSNGNIIRGYQVTSGGIKWKTTTKREAKRFLRQMKHRR